MRDMELQTIDLVLCLTSSLLCAEFYKIKRERGEREEREKGPHLLGDDERHGSSMANDGFLESDLLLERQRRVQVQRQLASREDAHGRLQMALLRVAEQSAGS